VRMKGNHGRSASHKRPEVRLLIVALAPLALGACDGKVPRPGKPTAPSPASQVLGHARAAGATLRLKWWVD
jgi:hypothetical protein